MGINLILYDGVEVSISKFLSEPKTSKEVNFKFIMAMIKLKVCMRRHGTYYSVENSTEESSQNQS